MIGFKALGLIDDLVDTVAALGYEEPTPIQREVIPLFLQGEDILAQAATGTGKTAAFALPMLQRLAAADGKAGGAPRGLVLVPTRELAMQVAEAFHKYGKRVGLPVVPVYGGAPIDQQIRSLKRGVQVVIATPGRALDHVRRGTLVLDQVMVLVLDEADEMLDLGFADDLEAILSATPRDRQSALFSATIPSRIAGIAARHLEKPKRVTIANEVARGEIPKVRQTAYIVARGQKPAALSRVLESEAPTSAIVFCRTRFEVDDLSETLTAHGYRAEAIHGGLAQRQRDRVMKAFRAGNVDILVATDVAARGLDIGHLSHVVNYDVPSAPEAYVHRIGRTGRASRTGTAITLAEPREHRQLRSIEAFTKQKIEVCALPTVADLRARRLELARASIRERVLAGDLDEVRVVVEALAQEFDIVDVASASIALMLASATPDKEPNVRDRKPPRAAAEPRDRKPVANAEAGRRRRTPRLRGVIEEVSRLWVGAGRKAGVRPGDLVGAITGEAGIDSGELGAIEIADRFSIVEVPTRLMDQIMTALRNTTIRGKTVTVRPDRPH
jgi:ATP-dependent RNA helicase DeaD